MAALFAVVSGFALYSHQEKQERVGLNAEETMALYMERWQDREYPAMLNMWQISTFRKIYGEGFLMISDCTVRYQVLYQEKYYEHMKTYVMVQLKEGGIWYINSITYG